MLDLCQVWKERALAVKTKEHSTYCCHKSDKVGVVDSWELHCCDSELVVEDV